MNTDAFAAAMGTEWSGERPVRIVTEMQCWCCGVATLPAAFAYGKETYKCRHCEVGWTAESTYERGEG